MDSSASPGASASTHRGRIIQGSCWTCRRRRIKCDLRKPTCKRCMLSSQPCSYLSTPPIKWVGGCATRGRLAYMPTHIDILASSPLTTKAMDSSDSLLYFGNAVLPRFQILEEPLEWDMNRARAHEALCLAMMAVSQAHYVRHAKVDVFDVVVVRQRARCTAIEGFRRILEQGVHSEEVAQRLFTINVLFCMLDGMIEPYEENKASIWHLRGGWAILHKWPHIPTKMLMDGGLQAHLLSIYATMDLVHALLAGEKPFFDAMTWRMFAGAQTWFGRLEAGDRFLTLLAALSDMASLGSIVHSNLPLDSTALMEKCLMPIEAILYDIGDSSASSWEVFCSVYELCAVIYMQRALRQRQADDEVVQDAVRRGVETLATKGLTIMMQHCIIFPLLVIGSHCTEASDRQEIRQVLSSSTCYLSFGNMQLMNDFLTTTWNNPRHRNWWETFSAISEQAFIF